MNNQNSDTQLRQALLGLAEEISERHTAPASTTIWLRAERRSRQLAMERATRPLRLMYALALAAAVIVAAFALYESSPTTTVLAPLLRWSAPAAILIVAGCWMLLRAGRIDPRPTS